jgi:putative ABC transport system substrate-binding protein
MRKQARIITVAMLLTGLLACTSQPGPNQPASNQSNQGGQAAGARKKVIFLYPIKVDALEEVERGVREELAQENVEFSVESAQGNAELFQPTVRAALRQNPDLLVCIGTQITQTALALEHEVTLPPIIFTAVTRPADVLPANQLSTPRTSNITGITDTPNDMGEATVALARKLKPELRRLGALYTPSESNSVSSMEVVRDTAKPLGIEVVTATTESGPAATTSALLAQNVDLILITKDKIGTGNVPTIVETALRQAREGKSKQPTPVIAMDSGSVESPENGAVAAASAPYYDIGRDTGKVVKRLLAGEMPKNIPITGPAKSRTYVNLTSASAFCLKDLRTVFPDAVFSGTEDAKRCAVGR